MRIGTNLVIIHFIELNFIQLYSVKDVLSINLKSFIRPDTNCALLTGT